MRLSRRSSRPSAARGTAPIACQEHSSASDAECRNARFPIAGARLRLAIGSPQSGTGAGASRPAEDRREGGPFNGAGRGPWRELQAIAGLEYAPRPAVWLGRLLAVAEGGTQQRGQDPPLAV